MKTDAFFYRLFKDHPETYFELLGQDLAKARNYRFDSVELKQVSLRIDGVLIPTTPELPVEFLEVQFYRHPKVYANLLAKVFLYLERNRPEQPWRATVLFGARGHEPTETASYRGLMESGQLVPLYLEELAVRPGESIELSIMRLAVDREAVAVVPRVLERIHDEVADDMRRVALLESVETVMISRMPQLTKEEFIAMFQLENYRKSRLFKEWKQEGIEEGKLEGKLEGEAKGKLEGKLELVPTLHAEGYSAAKIAELLGVPVRDVQKRLRSSRSKDR